MQIEGKERLGGEAPQPAGAGCAVSPGMLRAAGGALGQRKGAHGTAVGSSPLPRRGGSLPVGVLGRSPRSHALRQAPGCCAAPCAVFWSRCLRLRGLAQRRGFFSFRTSPEDIYPPPLLRSSCSRTPAKDISSPFELPSQALLGLEIFSA